MRIRRSLDLNQLARQLSGLEPQPGVDPWASRMRALARSISLIENDPWLALRFLQHPALSALTNCSRVVGLTGLPGAGKSSLTSLIVGALRREGHSVAVLAVDPSSAENQGAVLGDRIRMHDHFCDDKVFIRSMGSRGALGGVAHATRGAIRLLGLLGFDYILVETVGVGQSESDIVSIADTTLLVLMPNSGDDIQLMKAGVLQLADIYIVNKKDLGNPHRMMQEIHANTAPSHPDAWAPPVLATSATEAAGIEELVSAIIKHGHYEATHPEGRARRHKRVQAEVVSNLLELVEREAVRMVAELPPKELLAVADGSQPALLTAHRLFTELLSGSVRATPWENELSTTYPQERP